MAQITLLDDNKIIYFDENTGNYKIYDGERWWLDGDKFGTSTKPSPSDVALVDSAIVDKSVVGEEERPPMQTIWEGTFNGLRYLTEDIQNASLLKDAEEVTVTFDGVVYTATVTKQTSEDVNAYTFGASDPSFSDYPFSFGWTDSRTPVITMIAQTDGEHTIKVEYTPSPEPPMQTIWEGTFTATYSEDAGRYVYTAQDVQNGELIKNCNEVTVTFDGTTYVLPVNQPTNGYAVVAASSPFSSPFIDPLFTFFLSYESQSSTVLSTVTISTQTEGSHTIKVEGDLKEQSSSENPGGGSAIDLPGGEIAL